MCGRYATTRASADLSALFEADDSTGDGLLPDYNVAPTDPVPIVRNSRRAGGRVLAVARWGLVPAWARDTRGAARMINARAETVATSSAFARSFATRRCLVPADGWYEWVRLPAGGKQPYFMTPVNAGVLAFAGIWSVWGTGEDQLLTCGVITTPAVGDLTAVHDRMPLLLPPERWAEWLDRGPDESAGAAPTGPAAGAAHSATGTAAGAAQTVTAERLLAPPPADLLASLELRPVGKGVGDVRSDGPELIKKVPAPPLLNGQNIDADLTLF